MNTILPACAVRRADKLHSPDRKRRIHIPGRARLGKKKIDIDHYWYHGIAWYTVLPGIRSARQRPDTRNAVPGFLRLPHKLRDDASSRHCNLPAGVPCDGRQKDRRRNDPGKWHFQTKEDLQLYDQVSVSDFRCGYSDKLGRKCVRYYLNVTYDV